MDGYFRNASICFTAGKLLVFLLLTAGVCHAQQQWRASEQNDTKHREPCVLLANQNVLFGTARQEGESIIVTESDHSEIRLPRSAVACWAGSIEELYRYRVDHRQGNDVTVHLDDAEWCLQNNLLNLAQTELRQAYNLDSSHPRLRRLVERFDRQRKPAREIAPRVRRVELSEKRTASDSVIPVSHEENELPGVVHSNESIESFTRSVQSTLLNKCGRCHHQASSDRQWRLHMPVGRSRPSAQTSMRNLNSTLPFIDASAPARSELIAKATQPHAGQIPILDRRHYRAIDNLKAWLRVAASDLRLTDSKANSIVGSRLGEFGASSFSAETPSHDAEAYGAADAPAARSASQSRSRNSVPTRMPSVENPFDPDIFNRQFHR